MSRVCDRLGLRVAADEAPEQGYFFRSDQFAFASAGVPAVWLDGGTDYVGRPPGWGVETRARYRRTFYHRPSDEPQEDWDLAGLAQIGQVTIEVLREIARAGAVNWKPGSSFRRASVPASR